MFWLYTQSLTDSFELIGAGTVLTTSHTCGEVIRNHNGDIALVIDGIKQTGHT